MPVADLKDEILRMAQEQVGPEPLIQPAPRPRLGEPSDTDALKTEILRIAAAGEPRGAFRRYAGALGQTVVGAYGRGMEGIGLLSGGAQPTVADQAFDGAVPGEPGIANAAVEAGQALQPTLTRPGEEGVAQNMGTVTGSIATFAPAAALGGIPGFVAVTGAGTAQAAPDAFYSAKANGASDTEAWKVSIVSSLAQGALERLGPERLIGKIASAMAKADRATGGAGKELLWSALGEGGEEIGQHWADVAAQQLYEGTPDVDWAKELRSSLEQGAYGVAGGGAMGALALAAEKYAREEGLPGVKDAPTPYADKPDRSPPVYDPVERDLTPEEDSAIEDWKKSRGATRADVVERPDMAEATELARKAGLDVLFVDDDGKGAKEGATFNRRTAILPADADPATVGLAIATHEGVHGMPKSAREALRAALDSTVTDKKGKKHKSATAVALEQAGKDYADRAEKEGVKLSKADLEEEATADLVAALAPVAQRVMRNPARAVLLMNDKPKVMVKILDFVRKHTGKTTHAEMVAKELEALAEVQSSLAKGLTGRQRVQAATKIVESFEKIGVAMKQPVKVKAKQHAEPIGPAAAPEPTAVEARGEDVPVDPGLGALRAKDAPAPAPVISAKTKTLQESLDERAVSARGRATEKEARAQAIESRPRVTKAARRRAARLRNQAKMLNEGAASMETQSKALAWKNRDPNEQKSPGDRVRFEDGREGTVASSHEDGSLRVRVQRPPGKGESAQDAARVMHDYVTVRAPDVLRVESARPVEQPQAKAAPVAKDAPVRVQKPAVLTVAKEAIAKAFKRLSKRQTHYMGHKGDFFGKAADWLAENLDLRGVKTIYDMYAGGGTYGLTYALSGAAPDVQRVVVNEVDATRRHKFDIARRHGGDIMDPWDTSPFLIELRNTIDALVEGNDSTSPASLAIDTITGAESAKGAYEQYLPMRSRYQALSMDEKAALLALRDVMFSGRTATVAKLFENARQDADNVQNLVKKAAARGIKVDVVSMDALGPEAIKMVQGGGRSFVVLDPPYHGTASGNYSAGGKKYDFKSDEFLQMNLAAAKEMSRGNAVLYNNAATDGVRSGALAAFGSPMQTFEWLRQKRGDAPAQQEFLGLIDNGQGKGSGSRGNVGVGSASAASGKAGGNGGVLAAAGGNGRGSAGAGATGDAGGDGGRTRYSLASDAGSQGDDVEAARKAWKEQGTESPWFKRWFSGSKVVDGEGKPLVVYHGTTETDVGAMRPSFEAGLGIFFSDNDNVSETFRVPREYGEPVYQDEDGNDIEPGDLVSAYLKIENPFVVEDSNAQRFVDDTGYQVQVLKKARADGHDGVIVRDVLEGIGERYESTNYVVFKSSQVKSTGNRGTFDAANPDIRYSLKGDRPPSETIKRTVTYERDGEPRETEVSMTRPGFVYRGMSAEEYEASASRGWIESDLRHSIAGHEGTGFAYDADTAVSYATFGSVDPAKVGKPAYVVEVEAGNSIAHDPRDHYPKAKGRVPLSSMSRVWRYDPDGTVSRVYPASDTRYSLKSDIESVAADASEPEGYQHAIASEDMPARMVAKYVAVMNPTERRSVEEMMAGADEILADRSKREKLATRALNHEALNEEEQIALQRIASLKATNAWRAGTSMENAVHTFFAFKQSRSTSGRVLGNPALRDALQTPAERAMALALTPSKQVAKAYKKAKTWQARRAIVEAEAKKVERVRYALAERGFDPAMIPDEYWKDPNFKNVWTESVAEGKANGKWDWYIQWRRAAMLSGPITTVRNVTGNTSYVTYDRVARIWADALIPGTGTTVEDAREYTRDLFASLAQGWADARAAYSDFYSATTEGTSLDEHAAMRRGGIAGKALIGLEAVGIRAQAAQDIFFRTVVGHAETRLRARQKARAEGGSVEDYMQDPDVLAMSKEDMERALFLDRDGLTRAITGARDWADANMGVPVGTTIVPFAATPVKLVQRGGETLMGPIGGYMRDREKYGGALLGAGAWAAMIWAASMFDDDDGLPLITGSRARGGAGDFQNRTAPAYSIRIGDTYYSYQQIEPLSTALAAIADGIQSGDVMKSVSSFATAAKDKSFFRSIETVYDAVVGSSNGEAGMDRAKGAARDLLWTPMIPNILRSPLRATDDDRTKEIGDRLEARDFANAALPTGDFAPPLRHDLWGRPVEKDAASWVARVIAPMQGTRDVGDVEKIDLLLADYNRKQETDKFFSAPQVYVERNNVRRDWTEEEYSELTRDAGAQALTILRPWVAGKTELTERDIKHIEDVLSKTRARKVAEILRR